MADCRCLLNDAAWLAVVEFRVKISLLSPIGLDLMRARVVTL